MAINERLIHTASESASGDGNQQEGMIMHLDANDDDSYDGSGTVWYDITDHEFTPAVDPSEHFNTVLYTGDSSSSKNITGVGFQPDLVWIKNRSASGGHWITDSIRGAGKGLMSQSTLAETTNLTELMSSFNSDGFAVGYSSNNTTNFSGYNYVAWCFKAGGAPTATNTATSGAMTANSVSIDDELQSSYTPTDATIYPKKISANTKLGFSTVLFTGTGNSNNKVPHGLDVPPELIIFKNIDEARAWTVGSTPSGWNNYLVLNNSTAAADFNYFDDVAPTANVFEIYNGQANTGNDAGSDFIAYCFASKRGVSKVGGYTGTGAAGNKVYTGFEPAFIMMKKASATSDWNIVDNKTSTDGRFNKYLRPNTTGAEVTPGTDINIHADGFSFNGGSFNSTNVDWIYLAFAKNTKVADLTPSTDGTEIEKDLAVDSTKVYYTSTNYAIEQDGTVWRGNADNSTGTHEGEAYINNYFESGDTGKFYFEVESLGHTHGGVGFTDPTKYTASSALNANSFRSDQFYGLSVTVKEEGSTTSSFSNNLATAGTILAVAIDVATRKVWMGEVSSGTVSWYSSGNPSTGANPFMTLPSTFSFYQPLLVDRSYSGSSARTGWHKLLRQETASYLPTGFTYMKGAIKNADLELHLDPASYSGSGTTWSDLANSNDGTISGASYDEELGDSFDFDGSNDIITTSYDMPASGAKTIEIWFNASSTQNMSYPAVLGGANESLWVAGNITTTYSDESIYWYNNPSQLGLVIREGHNKYADNKWHHLVIVDTGSSHKMYIDGNEKSFTYSYGSSSTRLHFDNLHIGRGYSSTDSFFTGKVGQLRIYNEGLTADQVKQNFNFTKNDYPNGNNATGVSSSSFNTDGYFNVPVGLNNIAFPINFKKDQTLVWWVKHGTKTTADSNSRYRYYMFDMKTASYSYWQARVDRHATNGYQFQLSWRQDISNYVFATDVIDTLVNQDDWNMYACYFTGTEGIYYSVNGGDWNSATATTDVGTSSTLPEGNFLLGKLWSNGSYYSNPNPYDISDIKVFDKVLSSDELSSEYSKGQFGNN